MILLDRISVLQKANVFDGMCNDKIEKVSKFVLYLGPGSTICIVTYTNNVLIRS